jgi:hypothetical protein
VQGVVTTGAFKRRTLKVHAVREVDMLPNLLFALSHTTPALAHDGLEMLSMMVRFRDQTSAVQRGWLSAPLSPRRAHPLGVT